MRAFEKGDIITPQNVIQAFNNMERVLTEEKHKGGAKRQYNISLAPLVIFVWMGYEIKNDVEAQICNNLTFGDCDIEKEEDMGLTIFVPT